MSFQENPESRIWKFLGKRDPSDDETHDDSQDPSSVPSGSPQPSRLGKYLLHRELGQGGSAVVYEAVDTALGRRVALKVLKYHGAGNIAVTRLHREAKIAAQLDHPNIVRVHEVDVVMDPAGQSHHYIAMDFVEGTTLSEILREGKESRERLLKILEQVARAAGYAHGRGVVHRDLKPGNVMVDRAGRVYLADFGLARADMFDTRLTQSQAVLGTPMYMAPEQVRGSVKEISPRTDVYGLGATLYEMITGHAPHEGTSLAEIYTSIATQDPLPPRKLRPDVDRELEAIVLKALEKDPSRRYATGDDFAKDLGRYLNGESVEAKPLSVVTRVWRKALRRRAIVISAMTVAVILCALVVRETVRSRRNSAEFGACLAAAQDLEKQGKAESARDQYLLAVGLDGSNVGAREGFRRMEEECRRRATAQTEALRLLELARPPLYRAAQVIYEKDANFDDVVRRVDEGQRFVEQAIEKAPGLATGHYLLGCAWEAKGWLDRAEACWRKALEIDPKFGPAHFRLGRRLLVHAFLATLQTSSGVGPGRREDAERWTREATAELEQAVAQERTLENELQRRVAGGMLAYVRGAGADVRRIAEQSILELKTRPGVEDFYWLQSLTIESVQERMAILDRALAVSPSHPLVLFCRAIARQALEDWEGEIADCSRAIAVNPRFLEAYVTRANARIKTGDVPGALADCARGLDIAPGLPIVTNTRASAYERAGDVDRAMADYTESIRLDPRQGRVYAWRAKLRKAKGDLDGALADYEMVMKVTPELAPEAYGSRAAIRLTQGDAVGALADANEALRLAPALTDVHLNYVIRAQAYEQLGRLKEARSDYEQTLKRAPSDWRLRPQVEGRLRALGSNE